MRPSPKFFRSLLAVIGVCLVWGVYIALHVSNIFIVFAYLIFIYETGLGILIILWSYAWGVIRVSLPYIIIYFGLCLFNLHYQGYYRLTFLGVILNTLENQNKSNNFILHLKAYSYFYLLLFHSFFLVFIIYYELLNNIIFVIFLLTFYLLIFVNIQIKHYFETDKNWKTRYFHIFINISLIAIIGCYINIIYESLLLCSSFRLNFYEFLAGLMGDRLALKMAQHNKSWFSLFLLDKEYNAKNTIWLLTNKIVNTEYFTSCKNMFTKYQYFNKSSNRFFINMVNAKSEDFNKLPIYEKTSVNELNSFNNKLNVNWNNTIKASDTLVTKIDNSCAKGNISDIKHNLDSYLNWKLLLLDRMGLNAIDFTPTQDDDKEIFKDVINLNNDLDLSSLLFNKQDISNYNAYVDLFNKEITKGFDFNNLLKSKIVTKDLLKFNYFNENLKSVFKLDSYKDELGLLLNDNTITNLNNTDTLNDVMNSLNELKFFFYELYNYNDIYFTKPDLRLIISNYNYLLIFFEVHEQESPFKHWVNEILTDYEYDVTKVMDDINDSININYIDFDINDKEEKEVIAPNLFEFKEYQELYLSWYSKKTSLFYDFIYPYESQYFIDETINDILLDEANKGSFKPTIKSYLKFNFFISPDDDSEGDGNKIFQLSNNKLKEITVVDLQKNLKSIELYENMLKGQGNTFNFKFFETINLKYQYFKSNIDFKISKKLFSDLNNFVEDMEQDNLKAIELAESIKNKELLYTLITNPLAIEFLKSYEWIEDYFILLMQQDNENFKNFIIGFNESKCTLAVPEFKHSFLDFNEYQKMYKANGLKNDIIYVVNLEEEDIDVNSIHYQMEEIKRFMHFAEILFFTQNDLLSNSSDTLFESIVRTKVHNVAYCLGQESSYWVDYLDIQSKGLIQRIEEAQESDLEYFKNIYKKEYTDILKLEKMEKNKEKYYPDNIPMYIRLCEFNKAEELDMARMIHLDQINTVNSDSMDEILNIKNLHFSTLQAINDDIDEQFLKANEGILIEASKEADRFDDWIEDRNQIIIPYKKGSDLTTDLIKTNWDLYNKQSMDDHIFKSNLFKKK